MENDLLVQRALSFQKEWAPKVRQGHLGEQQHDREFLADFYEVFGISKSVYRAGFEYKVNVEGHTKRIDSLLPHVLIVEMESQGVPLVNNKNAGYEQAIRYAYAMKQDGKDDAPQYILASDFEHFYLKNPATGDVWTTTIDHFAEDIDVFSFLSGYEQREQERQAVVNKQAAESISKVYRRVLDVGVKTNAASLLMTRIVFCLFADDTQIFAHNGVFQRFLENTAEDGSDLLLKLSTLFKQLNTDPTHWIGGKREFGYINGGLFALDISKFTSDLGLTFDANVRSALIDASHMNWSKISPVIFGSMFEGALDEKKRHDLGAHFTSEKNIMKVVDSLFMDDLHKEFDVARHKSTAGGARTKALNELHDKITHLKFLDPACGSGNFLILAYRELRRLEHDIIDALIEDQVQNGLQLSFDFASRNIKVEVDQFYGIEIQPYAVSISRVGMWLMDHLMNIEASDLFGELIRRIPLHTGANIVVADALTADWLQVFNNRTHVPLDIDDLDYILGNPPFIGKSSMVTEQKESMKKAIGEHIKKWRSLDFVSGWYCKAVVLMQLNKNIKTAFVSTNSIIQGEQATILWPYLFSTEMHINFAHQTFKWDNNGAAVFVVIIGFEMIKPKSCDLFVYRNIKEEPIRKTVRVINEYLLPSSPLLLKPAKTQLSKLPSMGWGSKLTDGQNFLFTEKEKNQIVSKYLFSKQWFHPYYSARELLNQSTRYVVYLHNADASLIKKATPIYDRIIAVKRTRLESKKKATQKLANTPTLFQEDHVIKGQFIAIPSVSSANRDWVPMAFMKYPVIISNAVFQVQGNEALFALLESKLHLNWLQTVGGRLKGDLRYSSRLVYNTFCTPKFDEQAITILTQSGKEILMAREKYLDKGESLADIYDPIVMPSDLRKAHESNDKVVDELYGLHEPSISERVNKLISLYRSSI